MPPTLADVTATFVGALAAEQCLELPLTALDTVGIPVWAMWGRAHDTAAGDTLLAGIGYGDTMERARVGALGEALEHAASTRTLAPRARSTGSYAALRAARGHDGVVDPRLLGLPAGVDYDHDRPLQWLAMSRLRDGAEVLVPAEFVASSGSELRGDPPAGGWLTVPVSNGLGAGTSLEQAVTHALLEILQRDGNGLTFRALDRGRVLDLAGVSDPVTRDALARMRAAGIDVLAKVGSTEFGLPNVYVVGAAGDDDILAATACGEAVHPDREVALRKAVLEFASARARKRYMHGPLEPVLRIAPPGYAAAVLPTMDPADEEPRVLQATVDWLGLTPEQWRPRIEATVLSRCTVEPFAGLPTTSPAGGSSLLHLLRERLAGFDVLVADLSPASGGAHAAKVVVPGTEVETVAYGRIGERGVAKLLAEGPPDLVRVGAAPAGWSRVHLTAAAVQRLGGPAWLDRARLDRLAGGLLPLYREPARHTAQQVLARRAAAPD